jgi:Tfp pilus assembly protein PilF
VVKGLAIAAVLLATLDASGAAPWHLQNWQGRCELRIERRADSTAAWVEFYPGGRCHADGSDIRVLDENGTLLPHTISTVGPGDRLLVTFKIPATDRAWLYYGNRLPQPAQQPWQPRAGLLMTVYRLGEGRSDTVEEFRELVKNSTQLLGSGYRPKVFDGFSPFSDSDQFLAVYDGWIRIDDAATYSFCTNSDDSSLLYIDGRLVASFPGRHGPNAVWGERNGSISLESGVHRLTYFHAEYLGAQVAVAGWKPPGAKYYRLVEDNVFVPISQARIVSNESPSGPVLDFTFAYTANYVCDQFGTATVIGTVFEPLRPGAINARSVRWHFGDGQTLSQRVAHHAYLSEGLKTVTLEVADSSNRTWRVSHQFPVYAIEGNNAPRPERVGKRAAQILGGYSLDTLSLDELAVLAQFWAAHGAAHSAGQGDALEQQRVLRALLNRLPGDDERFGEYGVAYVRLLADAAAPAVVTQRKRAIETLLTKKLSLRDEVTLRLLYGDHLLFAEHDFAQAEVQYTAAAERAKSGELHRTALVRLGDVALEQGNIPLARERYAAAPLDEHQARTRSVLQNAYGHLVENYTKQKLYDEALATIAEWEAALPAEKLDGYSFILRVRIARAQGDARAAKRYASLIIDKLEADEHKPEAYYTLISLLIEQRDLAQARVLYERFKEAFPTNHFLERLGETFG